MAASKLELQQKVKKTSESWAKVVDAARYLAVEHRYKEKEYGIKWRSAFKIELEKEANKIVEKYGNPLDGQPESDNHFAVIEALVEKDFKDIQSFLSGKQYELLEMLQDNLANYEACCSTLRYMLKRENLHIELEEEQKA